MDISGFKKESVLVTGAAGFVGRNITSKLLKNKLRVLALIREHDIEIKDNNLVKITSDIRDFDLNILDGVSQVIHLAAYMGNLNDKDDRRYKAVNIEATRRLYEACKKRNIRFIYCSSTVTMQKIGKNDWYATSKKKATEIIKKDEQGDWVIVYPTTIIDSSRLTKGLVPGFLMARVGKKDRLINIVDVDSISTAICKIVKNKKLRGEYVLGGINISAGDYLKKMSKLRNSFYVPVRLPKALICLLVRLVYGKNNLYYILRKDFASTHYNSERAVKDLDYDPANKLGLFL